MLRNLLDIIIKYNVGKYLSTMPKLRLKVIILNILKEKNWCYFEHIHTKFIARVYFNFKRCRVQTFCKNHISELLFTISKRLKETFLIVIIICIAIISIKVGYLASNRILLCNSSKYVAYLTKKNAQLKLFQIEISR